MAATAAPARFIRAHIFIRPGLVSLGSSAKQRRVERTIVEAICAHYDSWIAAASAIIKLLFRLLSDESF